MSAAKKGLKVGSYECHVTLWPHVATLVQPIAKVHKFKTSVLKGDAQLGDDELLYLTTHDNDETTMNQRLDALLRELRTMGVEILRDKVEKITRDNIHVNYKQHSKEH